MRCSMSLAPALIAAFFFCPATAVSAVDSDSPQAVPGVEFTRIQDLNPNAPAKNRPIKQKWAVVVGASKFREGRLAPVDASDMDDSAKEFYDYLIDPHGGRFDKSHVKLLLNSNATRQNIMTALGPNWLGRVAGRDDLVVVYIATSGFPTTDGNTYLCAHDCTLDNIYGTCISMQSLMSNLKQNVHTDRIVLVLQAAYSGAAELDSGAKALYKGYNIDVEKIVLGNGFIILSSSKPNEMTWSSSFSKNLVMALRMEDGLISLNKAFAIAQDKTRESTSVGGYKKRQTPVMKSAWTGTDLVLGVPPIERVSQLPEEATKFLSAEGSYLKATQAIQAGNIDEALKQYKIAITADPKYADALADYGAALALKGDWQAASQMYQRAIAAAPNDELYHVNYARVLEKLGDANQCLSELNKAYALNPKDMSVLTALSKVSLAANQSDSAIRYLSEAVSLYPNSSDLRERLSYAYMKGGDADRSLEQAREAVRLDQKSASALINLASVHMILNEPSEAISTYKQAVIRFPKNADAHFLLSRALEKNGDLIGAQAELSTFLQICEPSDQRIATARAHLQELSQR